MAEYEFLTVKGYVQLGIDHPRPALTLVNLAADVVKMSSSDKDHLQHTTNIMTA